MSQTYTANCYQSDHVAVTDMANIEANFATLRSSNSGASAPPNTEAGLQWWDTVKNLLKIRNDANSAWLAILQGSASQKLWIYRNDSDDGWAIDATVTDRVLALKGGSGLYNANGGTNAGETWANLKAHTHTGGSHTHAHGDHVHKIYNDQGSDVDGQYYNSAGTAVSQNHGTWQNNQQWGIAYSSGDGRQPNDLYTALTITVAGTSGATASGAGGGQSTADVRPQAAIGTLQYPDI